MNKLLINVLTAAALAPAALAFASAPAIARLPSEAIGASGAPTSPEDAAAVFGVLRRAPAREIPDEIDRAVALMPSLPAKLAVDPSQIRRADVGSRTMYLAPLDDGLCIFILDGSVCSQHLDEIAKFGLALEVVPPVPGRIDPLRPPQGPAVGPITVYGLAPDGIASVEAATTTGGTVMSPVVDNAYVIVADHPVVDIEMRP